MTRNLMGRRLPRLCYAWCTGEGECFLNLGETVLQALPGGRQRFDFFRQATLGCKVGNSYGLLIDLRGRLLKQDESLGVGSP